MYSFSSIFQSPMAMVYWSEFARQITFAKMKSSHGAHEGSQHRVHNDRLAQGQRHLRKNLPSGAAVQQAPPRRSLSGIVSKNPLANLEGEAPLRRSNTESAPAGSDFPRSVPSAFRMKVHRHHGHESREQSQHHGHIHIGFSQFKFHSGQAVGHRQNVEGGQDTGAHRDKQRVGKHLRESSES